MTVDKVERAAEVSQSLSKEFLHPSLSLFILFGPQLLGSFRYKGQAVDSHLLVIAATDPSPEVPPGIKQYPWFLAAKKIVAVSHINVRERRTSSVHRDGFDLRSMVPYVILL